MPYMLTIPGNRKKKVRALLQKYGIKYAPGPIDGYLIAYDDPQKVLENFPRGVKVIAPISEAEIEMMSERANVPIKTIEVKDVVKVINGVYSGFHGIVTRVDDKEVSVGINVFGKVVPVIVGREEIEKATTLDWV